MKSPALERRPSKGHSLLGLTMSMSLLGFALGGGGQVLHRGYDAYVRARAKSLLTTRARDASQHLASLLSTTSPDALFPASDAREGASVLRFRQPLGVGAGATEWGPLMRLEREYEPGEIDDGRDNDGNGLADDGRLVLTRDVGGRGEVRIVLCHGLRELLEGEVQNGADDNENGQVDEPGFELAMRGRALRLRLTLESPDGRGGSEAFTVERSIELRN